MKIKTSINKAIFLVPIFHFFTLFTFAQTPTTVDGWFKLAGQQLKQKQYDAAVRSYSECIKLNPRANGCFRGRSVAHTLLKNYEPAISDATQAILLNDKDDLAYGIRGDAYRTLKRYPQSITDYSALIALKPSGLAYFTRGNSYLDNKKYQEAVDDYNKALSLTPDLHNIYGNRADAYFALAKYELALADYTKFIQFDPSSTKAYLERGRTYTKLDKDQEAINDYTKAISIDPKYVWAYNNRGVIYAEQKKYDLAIADYSKAIEVDNNTAMFFRNRGSALYEQKKYDQSIVDLKKAIEIEPKFAWAYNNLGSSYYKQKKYAEAAQSFKKAIEFDASYSIAFHNLGLVYKDQNEREKSIGAFTKAIEINNKYANAYKQRGEVYKALNKFDEALADFLKATELDPNNADRWVDLGAAYDLVKQPEKNFEYNKKALELNPKHNLAYFNLGGYYYNKNDYLLAYNNFDRSIQHDQTFANAFYGRARANCHLGKIAEATSDEKKASELGIKITNPCRSATVSVADQLKKDVAPPTKTDFELANIALLEQNYPQAVLHASSIHRSSTLIQNTKLTQIFTIGQRLASAKQTKPAIAVLESIFSLPYIDQDTRIKTIYLLGNIYFNEKNYSKAHEYYNKIPENLDARKNNIRVYYLEKAWKPAAELVISTLELLNLNYLTAKTQSDKKLWVDATNQFLKDSWGVANEFATKPDAEIHALLIYKAKAKIIPSTTADGKTLLAKIKEMETK